MNPSWCRSCRTLRKMGGTTGGGGAEGASTSVGWLGLRRWCSGHKEPKDHTGGPFGVEHLTWADLPPNQRESLRYPLHWAPTIPPLVSGRGFAWQSNSQPQARTAQTALHPTT